MSDKPEKLKLIKPTSVPDDAADIDELWIDPELGDDLTETKLHGIPVGKPKGFFRIHPDPTYRQRTELYTHQPESGGIEKEYYIVGKKMRGEVDGARFCTLVTCIDRGGSLRIWPLMAIADDSKGNDAWVSARDAARQAIKNWVRITWKKRAYVARVAKAGYAPEPDWKKLPPFNDLVRLAFGPHGIIRGPEHPIYRDLVGDGPAPTSTDDIDGPDDIA